MASGLEEVVSGRDSIVRTFAICVATMSEETLPGSITTFRDCRSTELMPYPIVVKHNSAESNAGLIGSYNDLYENTPNDILAFIHDDVICREKGWDERVLAEFDDPNVGVVGFGGALQHGSPLLYKTPYVLQQLARFDYRSNVDDAELHGERFKGACDVAVLDGFALVVRRDLLVRGGGWPRVAGGFHCYDYAICALAHRFRYRVRMVGIACHHLGGRTSTTPQYQEWAQRQGVNDQEVHTMSHRWIYDEYSDVLPWRCEP